MVKLIGPKDITSQDPPLEAIKPRNQGYNPLDPLK